MRDCLYVQISLYIDDIIYNEEVIKRELIRGTTQLGNIILATAVERQSLYVRMRITESHYGVRLWVWTIVHCLDESENNARLSNVHRLESWTLTINPHVATIATVACFHGYEVWMDDASLILLGVKQQAASGKRQATRNIPPREAITTIYIYNLYTIIINILQCLTYICIFCGI